MSEVSDRTGTPIRKKNSPKTECAGSREMMTVPSPSEVLFSMRTEPEKMKYSESASLPCSMMTSSDCVGRGAHGCEWRGADWCEWRGAHEWQ
jgi:hypothetical protein